MKISPITASLRAMAIMLVVVAGSALLSSTAAESAAPRVTTTETVNMRVAPNLSGAVIDKVPVGSSPRIRCAMLGALIYDTPIWFYVEYGARRGFYSAYYSTAEYETWADLWNRYGIPRCDRPGSAIGGSLYYQPRFSDGDPIAPYSTYTATKDWWAPGGCSASEADYWPSSFDGKVVTRAGAWSLGRLGVTYLLSDNFNRATALDTIILFDPGSLADYQSECDLMYDQDGLMARWLSQSRDHRLLVLAGKVTRDASHPDTAGRLHQGIQRYLFPDVKAAGRSSQVLVCNYDRMSHADVMKHFSYLIASGSVTVCPTTSTIKPDASWRP